MSTLMQGTRQEHEADLRLSHAFVSTLAATYRGMWVFESTLMQIDDEVDREEELEQSERVLETVAGWWRLLQDGQPLFHLRDRPVLDGEASRAWRLLQVAEGRCRSLIGELTQSTDVETLVEDPWSRKVRTAGLLEVAHAQRETVRGLVRLAEILGRPDEADQWRQRILAAEARIGEAEAVVERLLTAAEVDVGLARELFDATLLLPAQVAQRVIDMCQVFGLYTGVFDYADAGIPEAQSSSWADAGFEPRIAGRWFAAGLTPRRAAEWISIGAGDPLVAAGFMWRGFTPSRAAPWLERFIEGRRAVAWQSVGCDAEDAREWIALGIRDPAQVSGFRPSMRTM